MTVYQFLVSIITMVVSSWFVSMYFRRPKDIAEWGISFGILAGMLISAAILVNRYLLLKYSLLETEIISMFIAFAGIVAAYVALLFLLADYLRGSRTIITGLIKNIRNEKKEG